MAEHCDSVDVQKNLQVAQQGIDDALASFPDYSRISQYLSIAYSELDKAINLLPERLINSLLHRLQQKKRELEQALALASSARVRVYIAEENCIAGESFDVEVEFFNGGEQPWSSGLFTIYDQQHNMIAELPVPELPAGEGTRKQITINLPGAVFHPYAQQVFPNKTIASLQFDALIRQPDHYLRPDVEVNRQLLSLTQ